MKFGLGVLLVTFGVAMLSIIGMS